MSTRLIESHYENNYGAALRRLNAVTEQLERLDVANAPGYQLAALKRDELTALNSTGRCCTSSTSRAWAATVGSPRKRSSCCPRARLRQLPNAGRDEFMAMGYALGGGSRAGCCSTWVPRDVPPRELSSPPTTPRPAAGAIPVLALDMYEHAYHIDFGANARRLRRHLHAQHRLAGGGRALAGCACATAAPRPLVQPEFGDLPGVGPEEVKAMLDAGQSVQVIDARPRHYFSRDTDIMDGAVWRDPERIAEWSGRCSQEGRGRSSCSACTASTSDAAWPCALREQGYDARYMQGGHSAWKAIGGATKMHA